MYRLRKKIYYKIKEWRKKNKLYRKPFILDCCKNFFTISPKKLNSIESKITKVVTWNNKVLNAYILGIGHNLKEHSIVLISGDRTKDLISLNYKVVRGFLDAWAIVTCNTSHFKYGKKNINLKKLKIVWKNSNIILIYNYKNIIILLKFIDKNNKINFSKKSRIKFIYKILIKKAIQQARYLTLI